jgi:acyl-coenzyme A synthetase/AMP-(fatty) acid ligase
MGGEVILLHPDGNLSMSFFSETIRRQQVTVLNIAPSLLNILTDYLRNTNNNECLKTLRCISSGGKKQYFQAMFLL